MISIDEMASFCKKKGFVYRTSEIYNGLAGFFDFGPLGVEVKNAIKRELWQRFVQSNEFVVGIDGAIISHPRVWVASGHAASFSDALIEVGKGKEKVRADHLIEDKLDIKTDGMSREEMIKIIRENKLADIKEDIQDFNLMFTTNVGPSKGDANEAYLRPETAQLIFSDFKQVLDSSRKKLPFGIAQVGKAFRNEISPRDFLFRSREFEQFEIEFFAHPDRLQDCPLYDGIKDLEVNVLTAKDQENKSDHGRSTIAGLVESKIFKTAWHAYWVAAFYRFFLDLGIKPEHLRLREHLKDELAHYASACVDIEYKFPFGWKEIHGNADRGQFDLSQHIKESKVDLSVFDEETKQKVVPYCAAEPSQGIERAFLSFMYDAYDDDKERGNVVLRLHPRIAPVKAAVLPLVNKLDEKAREIFEKVQAVLPAMYDRSGSIGRRYARADESGIPFCVTVDFDTLEDGSVTVRNRDTTEQERIKIDDLPAKLREWTE
ncbi:MAG: glycine--tRNA ligase [archaeon]